MDQQPRQYDSPRLHRELMEAGLDIEGVTSEGRIDWRSRPGPAELEKAAAVLAAHNPQDPEALRRKAFLEKGIDAEALVLALWEKIMEGKPEAADRLQQAREQVQRDLAQWAA